MSDAKIRWTIRHARGAWLHIVGNHEMWVIDETVDAVHAGWNFRAPKPGLLRDGEEWAVRIDVGGRRGNRVTTGDVLAAVAHALGLWPSVKLETKTKGRENL